jgi:hypothetical protein
MQDYIAIQIGGLAKNALAAGMQGKIMGITSSGIFLNSGDKILFLTPADYKSPYNIQIGLLDFLAAKDSIGDQWSNDGSMLLFPDSSIRIDIKAAQVWQPSPLPQITSDPATQIEHMQGLLQCFCELDASKGWLFLADCKGSITKAQNPESRRIHQMTDHFIKGIKRRDVLGCLRYVRSILGLGGGLTPSGDDWLTGFFLFRARRAQALQQADPFISSLGAAVNALAFEAACQGWAEELFLEVVDYLLIKERTLSDEKLERLFGFGHSSGVDTCMGIKAGLLK